MRSSFPRRVAEGAPEAAFYFFTCGRVVLPAAVGDLDRAHHRAEFTGTGPVPTVRDAVEQARPVGVAAAGRIDDAFGFNARDFVALTAREDERALAPLRIDERLYRARHVLDLAAGLVFKKLALVIVHRHIVGKAEELAELRGGEHRQALPGIEEEGHAGLVALAGVLHHAVLAVRPDDGNLHPELAPDVVLVREVHRA